MDEVREPPAIEWMLHEGRNLCVCFMKATLTIAHVTLVRSYEQV